MALDSQCLAVYTTIYPGVESYVPDWYHSVQAQTDREFQLWIGLDGIEAGSVERVIGARLDATWVASEPGDTPAQIRQRGLAQIVKEFEAVVMVDSDDILHRSRVAAARASLKDSDLAGCALRLVDQRGEELGLTFGLPPATLPEDVLPRNNVFGLSNSAYRSSLLRKCLPIPAEVVLVDWYLATKAWLMGARLAFDPVVRMDYRQHGANTARVRYPVDAEQVVRDTELVRRHFRHVMGIEDSGFASQRQDRLKKAAFGVEMFYERITQKTRQLQIYVEALNRLKPAPLWWSCVAHPALESMWHSTT